ncbi:MAG: hypothetical protein IMY71_01485 [Bacteroidetes bacterium]|nr:hypothetical protein [Bacteroidota bacterium]
MKKFIWLYPAIYLVLSLYFAIFNWDVFIISINTNLGFAVVKTPPFLLLFLLGLFIIVLQSNFDYIRETRHEVENLQRVIELEKLKKDNEINNFKASILDSQTKTSERNIQKLGEIQDVLAKITEELETEKKKVKEKDTGKDKDEKSESGKKVSPDKKEK